MIDIAAIEKYLNDLVSVMNDKKRDHFDRVDAHTEFKNICRFLKKFLPSYMGFTKFQEWMDKDHFPIEAEEIKEEKSST